MEWLHCDHEPRRGRSTRDCLEARRAVADHRRKPAWGRGSSQCGLAVPGADDNGAVTNSELVTARDLDAWCKDLSSQSRLPILVRQLILATAPVTEITMPAREGVLLRGWDGLVRCPVADAHVPLGLSGWELGTSDAPRDKAQRDIRNRTRSPQGVDRAVTTFVAVSARIWPDRERWRDARRRDGGWADVRAYDAHDLELWMERVPSAHVRISEMLGREPRDVRTPDGWWQTWSAQTDPALPLAFPACRPRRCQRRPGPRARAARRRSSPSWPLRRPRPSPSRAPASLAGARTPAGSGPGP